MTTLLVLASIVLLIVVTVQIGRISELSAKIRGEEAVQLESNKSNSRLGMFFMVGFLVFCVASALYYKNYMIGYGPLHHASIHGKAIQGLFNWTLFFTGIVFILTHIALFWFGYKYRGEKGRKVLFMPHDNKLEVIWTVIPAVVMCGLVVGGLWVWNDSMADVAEGEDHIEIEATGYQFGWTIRYPGADGAIGKKYYKNIVPGVNDIGVDFNDVKSQDDVILANEELFLPKGKKVRVRITSKDVLHNFYLPHFSVKMDAIPGLPTYFVFTPTLTTEEYRMNLKKYPEYNVPADPAEPNGPKKWEVFNYELACAELCGKGHFSMRRILKIVEQGEYDKWAAAQKPFFPENIDGKVEAGKYSWWKGNEGATTSAAPAAPAEFSTAAVETAKVGEVLNLKHVNFATGSAVLTPESAAELSLVVAAMTKSPTMTVEVGGHTDNAGNPAKNKALSEARAKAVAAFVTAKGVDAKRMMAVGYGDAKPIADNATKEGKATNRRTEFKIASK
jgi:cytochrome c oxidase subunit II